MTYWMGVDVGTGGTRALLIDESGHLKHAFTAPHQDMYMERPLWASESPFSPVDRCAKLTREFVLAGLAGGLFLKWEAGIFGDKRPDFRPTSDAPRFMWRS